MHSYGLPSSQAGLVLLLKHYLVPHIKHVVRARGLQIQLNISKADGANRTSYNGKNGLYLSYTAVNTCNIANQS